VLLVLSIRELTTKEESHSDRTNKAEQKQEYIGLGDNQAIILNGVQNASELETESSSDKAKNSIRINRKPFDMDNRSMIKKNQQESNTSEKLSKQYKEANSKTDNHHKNKIFFVLYLLGFLICLLVYYFIEFSSALLHLSEFIVFNKYSELKNYLLQLITTKPNIRFKYYTPENNLGKKELEFDNVIDISDNVNGLTVEMGKNLLLEVRLEGILDEQSELIYKKKTKRVYSNSEIDIYDLYERYVIYQVQHGNSLVQGVDREEENKNESSVISEASFTSEDDRPEETNQKKRTIYNSQVINRTSNSDSRIISDNALVVNQLRKNKLVEGSFYNRWVLILSIIFCLAEFYKLLIICRFSTKTFSIRKQLHYYHNINSPETQDDITIKV